MRVSRAGKPEIAKSTGFSLIAWRHRIERRAEGGVEAGSRARKLLGVEPGVEAGRALEPLQEGLGDGVRSSARAEHGAEAWKAVGTPPGSLRRVILERAWNPLWSTLGTRVRDRRVELGARLEEARKKLGRALEHSFGRALEPP